MPEICLRVVELLIQSNPKAVRCLNLVSKSLSNLLASCETSLTKIISRNENNFINLNGLVPKVIASHDRLRNTVLHKHTYPWLYEMYYRKEIAQFLMNHEITEMAEKIDDWLSLDLTKEELRARLYWFRSQALLLLFGLADCVAGLNSTRDIREKQSRFLHSLSVKELACVGMMVEVMGHNFFIITKRSLLKLSLAQHTFMSTDFFQLTSSLNNPLFQLLLPPPFIGETRDHFTNDIWVRETMCVFEDLVQMYGPFFAWAYFEGSKDKLHRSDMWAIYKIQEGLDNMNAFELGYPMSYASLQSVVWEAFREKHGCHDIDSWNIARRLLEKEINLNPTEDKFCR